MSFFLVLLFLVFLNILVMVHESGHFLIARLTGMKVHEFSVGFGPRLWSAEKRGIKYSLRAILLGGYVKIAGMDQALEGEPTYTSPDDPGHFFNKPLWARIAVILAGSVFNILFAVLMFIFIFKFFGIPIGSDKPIIGYINPQQPSYYAGLREGDRIASIDGQPVRTWSDISRYAKKAGNKRLTLVIERNGKEFIVGVHTEYSPYLKKYIIGIGPQIEGFTTVSWKRAIWGGISQPGNILAGIIQAVKKREKLGLMGPIGAAEQVSGFRGEGVFYNFLFYMAILGVSLGYLNLLPLPLPLLDGGWVVIFLLEAFRRKPFSETTKSYAQIAAMLLVLGLFIFILYRDIANMIFRKLAEFKMGAGK
ncbi:MAG: M50 family metallopeptidase [Bacillota bacterium]